ncbi:indolepyruvate oxidoreductase subunit IorA [Planctomycetales bacterium]|nr:indolepyruvate oxidoreductase subunit IorA [Planctomycetales bacterium]GHT00537.1 indolepyruvate oxidoreductase subunit IorA [Planctomycetales bacterium]GHT03340.1 indolepyruvate oxidoreductase subunit IorA [Planctomycetales bacterium]
MELLSGNEAIARGAWEAGVTLAVGYPGTPSTEILENIVQYKNDLHAEWAPNEKVALEVAVGASLGGARALVTMKHVGLNVAADPLMTLAMIGVRGGVLLVVADDPGMHSSQNEQDSRHWGAFAKIPVLEPASAQEASAFVHYGLELSEKCKTPVILRTTTRLAHSRSLVELRDRTAPTREINFVPDQPRWVTIPLWARKMRVAVEQRLANLSAAAEFDDINPVIDAAPAAGKKLGIVAGGIVYQHAREIFPDAAFLKLGMVYPLPEEKIRRFAADCVQILVIEELDALIETQIKAWGIPCAGREFIPGIGEITPDTLRRARAVMTTGKQLPVAAPPDLPARPPVLCPGCPHRGVFVALKKFNAAVMGDIGCYSLAALPPLSRLNSILCMGGAIGMAHGLQKAGAASRAAGSSNPQYICGVLGDSTFFHSGITGLMNTVYNGGNTTTIVLDNRITAMTGHQENPGSGKTLEGEPVEPVSIAAIGRAVGVKRISTVNPYNVAETVAVLAAELAADAPSLIISQAPCPLHAKKAVGPAVRVNHEKCVNCRACLQAGCPAVESPNPAEKPTVNAALCAGCGICAQMCPKKAIGE